MKTIKARQLGQSLLLYFFQRVARVIRHVSGILLFEVRSGKLSKRAFDDTVRPLQYLSISQSKKISHNRFGTNRKSFIDIQGVGWQERNRLGEARRGVDSKNTSVRSINLPAFSASFSERHVFERLSALSRLQYTLAVEQIVVVARRSRPGDVRNCRYLSGVDDAEAYQLENQLDIGDYDVRALLIRPQKSEEARSTGEPYGYSEGFGH
ncbi:Major royal jelly protein 2 [Vespula maculifrons]|uniref:Major royal jelly protein 2 n=1 Tax=Vespula maculifrons TaxID=7453 RepID=A0ABD2C0R1_VESMC